MKKSCLLISLFFILSSSMCFSAEIKIFDKFDDNHRISIRGAYCYNFGDTIIFYGNLWNNSKDSIMKDLYLFYYYNNHFIKFGLHEIIQDTLVSYNYLTGFLKDKDNSFWFSFNGGGLYKQTGTKFTVYDSLIKANSIKQIDAMTVDNDGNLFIKSNAKLLVYDGKDCKLLIDGASHKYFHPYPSGGKLHKIDDKIYFINHMITLAYYDIKEKKVDTVSFYKNIKSSNYQISDFKLYDESLYFIYTNNDEAFHFAKYDGNQFTNLDFYFNLLNDGKPMKNFVNLAFDKNKNLYVKIHSSDTPNGDSIFVIDKDLNKTSINYRNIGLKSEITISHAITLSNGEVYLPNGYEGFLIITNPTSVETPSNQLFMNRLYPNPARDRFSIDFGVEPVNLGSMKVEIYDYLGRSAGELNPEIVYDSSTGNGTMKCEAGNLPKGMYIVVLSNGKYNRTMTLFLN